MKEGEQKDKNLTRGFLNKKLNKEETEAFRDKMHSTAFQEKVSEEAVRQYGAQQLRSKLDDIHLTVAREQYRKKLVTYSFLMVLAALLALASWRYIFSVPSLPALQPTEIFAVYFKPYPSIFEQKGEAAEAEQGFIRAHQAYSEERYKEAAKSFEKLLAPGQNKNSLNSFYYSLTLLANQQFDKAIPVLEALKKNANTLVPKAPLYWYLALAYLEENRIAEARPLLEWIVAQQKNNFMQQESEEILQLL